MKIGNTLFIPQNIAPPNAKQLVIFDTEGKKKGNIALGNLKRKDIGPKLYSSLVISDVHTFANKSYKDDSTANNDYIEALQFAQDNADFTCICGDLTCYGTTADLEHYRDITSANKGDMPVYAIAGNHEYWGTWYPPVEELDIPNIIQDYTGFPLHYTITNENNPIIPENDVFIFCGCISDGLVFDESALQWLYEQLEEHRNKRCFLFQHSFIQGSEYCGDAIEKYGNDLFYGRYRVPFVSLLSHYRNTICFHGHSHETLNAQLYTESLDPPLPANYDHTLGCHSVHIPSLAIPYNVDSGERVLASGKSEGYLMEVYENHIILKGLDFVKKEFIPIATYCLDTALVNIPAKTFKDSTGIITIR